MKIYLAPMEGITGYNYRNAYREAFADADRYFTPFISTHKKLGNKVKDEISPDNNPGINLVPQVMVATGDEYLELERLIGAYGYNELNINAGCPSGTVVTKNRGAGLLKNPDNLERLLTQVFDKNISAVSIKTRIGWENTDEWKKIAKILGEFPFSEVIIHARVREEFYNGHAHRDAMSVANEYIHCPICYNGDLFSAEDIADIEKEYPWLDSVMIGRGLLRRPWLIEEYRRGEKLSEQEQRTQTFEMLNNLFAVYMKKWNSEINTLYHMKELWFHLGESFPDSQKDLKTIRKTKSVAEYNLAVSHILK